MTALPHQTETQLQLAVVKYLRARGLLFFHCPNGGARRKVEAAILKGMGVQAGVPDLIILERWVEGDRHGFGLALELKDDDGRATESQLDWLDALEARGWYVRVVRTLDAAAAVIDRAIPGPDLYLQRMRRKVSW